MKYHLRITEEAADLLLSVARWYAEQSQSLDVATTWYDGFIDELHTLEHNPYRGAVSPENELFDFELRELHYGSGKRITHIARCIESLETRLKCSRFDITPNGR